MRCPKKMRRIAGYLLLGTTALVMAAPVWTKPYMEWSKKDALRILQNSPWTARYELRRYRGRTALPSEEVSRGEFRTPDYRAPGENVFQDTYWAWLFSAAPVRQAYARLIALENGYDRMSPPEQAVLERQLAPLVEARFPEHIVVAFDYGSNDRDLLQAVQSFLRTATVAQFLDRAYLLTPRAGRLSPLDYQPPTADGTGAKFIFPRYVDGEPVVTAEDKELAFELTVPVTEEKLYLRWKIKDLVVGGELLL